MSSRSAGVAAERPFYAVHADAYDALLTDPVGPWVEAIHGLLNQNDTSPGSIVDAGCGTGRQAQALIALGYRLTLVDASRSLLDIASKRCPGALAVQADICQLGCLDQAYDAVISRGVLNDLTEEAERAAVFDSFASVLRPGGLVVLDVRDRESSLRQADGQWRVREVQLEHGKRLRFSYRPTWGQNQMLVDERYELFTASGEPLSVHEYAFRMVPWTKVELQERLTAAGFTHIDIRPGLGKRGTDRLLATARH